MTEEVKVEQLCVRIPADLNHALNEAIPANMKSIIIRCLLEHLASECAKHGKVVLGEVLAHSFDISAEGSHVTVRP